MINFMIRSELILRVVIGILLSLSGCSEVKREKTEKEARQEKELEQYLKAFNERSIYKTLTQRIIDTIPDDKLLQVVFDNLIEKLSNDHENEYETVMTWNKSRRAIYMIWLLEWEVNNGGYNQFYYNPSGQFRELLPDALKLVGASQFAALTQKANDIYQKENATITKYQDGSTEGFSKSYESNPLDVCDDAFYALYKKENLPQIQMNYIRTHKQDFVDEPVEAE
ncbi:DUF4375 domain-containing protein [Niabella sp.]|uniref:DMP19 family protein n=1 Tax=Niabella sp. TaxID=1962976 RepID=UPI0026252995|nr:DUF4375 domain-containing protein [Niabella sp.]